MTNRSTTSAKRIRSAFNNVSIKFTCFKLKNYKNKKQKETRLGDVVNQDKKRYTETCCLVHGRVFVCMLGNGGVSMYVRYCRRVYVC